jgi:hypothetical protein
MTDPRAALAEALADAGRDALGYAPSDALYAVADRTLPHLAERGVLLVTEADVVQAYLHVLDGPMLTTEAAVGRAIFAALSGEVTDPPSDVMRATGAHVDDPDPDPPRDKAPARATRKPKRRALSGEATE